MNREQLAILEALSGENETTSAELRKRMERLGHAPLSDRLFQADIQTLARAELIRTRPGALKEPGVGKAPNAAALIVWITRAGEVELDASRRESEAQATNERSARAASRRGAVRPRSAALVGIPLTLAVWTFFAQVVLPAQRLAELQAMELRTLQADVRALPQQAERLERLHTWKGSYDHALVLTNLWETAAEMRARGQQNVPTLSRTDLDAALRLVESRSHTGEERRNTAALGERIARLDGRTR